MAGVMTASKTRTSGGNATLSVSDKGIARIADVHYGSKSKTAIDLVSRFLRDIESAGFRLVQHSGKLQFPDFTIDYDARNVVKNSGKWIAFTPTEFDLLWLLVQREGEPVTKSELLGHWYRKKRRIPTSRAVDVHVSAIRVRLAEAKIKIAIDSVHRVGYRLRRTP